MSAVKFICWLYPNTLLVFIAFISKICFFHFKLTKVYVVFKEKVQSLYLKHFPQNSVLSSFWMFNVCNTKVSTYFYGLPHSTNVVYVFVILLNFFVGPWKSGPWFILVLGSDYCQPNYWALSGGSGTPGSRFSSGLHSQYWQLLAVWYWANYSISLSFNLLTYNKGGQNKA